jgi:hypothetical protein
MKFWRSLKNRVAEGFGLARVLTRSNLIAAAALVTGTPTGASAQTQPAQQPWVQWLLISGHTIEDGRACGLVDPDEVENLYVAVLLVSKNEDSIDLARAERVLRVARDHARDEPVTPRTCKDAGQALPRLRNVLAPYLRALHSVP